MRHALTLLCLLAPLAADARGLSDFVRQDHPATGKQTFLGALRVPRLVEGALAKVPVVKERLRTRPIVQVTNENLASYVEATAKGYLEVVVPAGKGHVFFRYGKEVFDFYPGGFRVGGVRPVGSERYGMLVPLTPTQEAKLARYLDRLKATGGKELGAYDFEGEKGFHCVTWIMRLALEGKGGGAKSLVQALGGRPRDGGSMPAFARFMLRRARPVEAVVLYQNDERTPGELGTLRFNLLSSRELRRAFAEEGAAAVGGARPAR
jgi:hypothetical protein